MAAPVFNKEKKKQIRGELEDLLASYSNDSNSANSDLVDEELNTIAMASPIDFDDMNKSFERKAKDITKSMLKFYVDLGVINNDEYIKQKQTLDNTNIKNIMFQLKTLRMAIEKIAEEINQGNTHPRLFEVFGQLQDKLTTVIKTQANYILFLEDTYKKMNQEIGQQTQSGQQKQVKQKNTDYFISAGTKTIMDEIEITEVSDITETSGELTNPSKKSEIIKNFGVSETIDTENDTDISESVNDMI